MASDWLGQDIDDLSYFDSEAFKAYTDMIEAQLPKLLETQQKSTDTVSVGNIRGMTIGELHRRLGDKARREWTMDALGYVEHLMFEGHPTRYWVSKRPAKIIIRIGGSVILEEVDKREKWESKKQAELS